MFHAVAESVCSRQKASLYTQNIVSVILLRLDYTVCQLAPSEILISGRKFSFSYPASATLHGSLWPMPLCALCSFIIFAIIIVMKIVILQETGWRSTNQSIMKESTGCLASRADIVPRCVCVCFF